MEYHIPLILRPGRFVMEAEPDGTELPEGFFSVRQTPCDFLEYTHPVYGGRPVRVYHVPENALLVAGYDADGELYQVSWVLNDEKQGLVYVAAPHFDAFISVTGRKMADRILRGNRRNIPAVF